MTRPQPGVDEEWEWGGAFPGARDITMRMYFYQGNWTGHLLFVLNPLAQEQERDDDAAKEARRGDAETAKRAKQDF